MANKREFIMLRKCIRKNISQLVQVLRDVCNIKKSQQGKRSYLFHQNYVFTMRSCVECENYCDSVDTSPVHSEKEKIYYQISPNYHPQSRQKLKFIPDSPKNLQNSKKSLKDQKLKKSLKRETAHSRNSFNKINSNILYSRQPDPYMLRQKIVGIPVKDHCQISIKFKNYGHPLNSIKSTEILQSKLISQNQRTLLTKNQSQKQLINFNFLTPNLKSIESLQTKIPNQNSMKKNSSAESISGSLFESPNIKNSSKISLKKQQSQCHCDLKEVSFKDLEHQRKSTISRNPEEPTTDHQQSTRNTHLFNFARDSKKVFLYKSAINLDEFRCVRAQSIGAESESSDHYSEVIFRKGDKLQNPYSKRNSLAEISKSKTKSYSKLYGVNTSTDKLMLEQNVKNISEMRSVA